MLILSRKAGESIYLKDARSNIRIAIVQASGNVRLGIDAPQSFVVVREECLPPEQRPAPLRKRVRTKGNRDAE